MTPHTVSLLPLWATAAALAGLVVGSFLNVVAYRAPRGMSVSTPRSFCTTCDRQLLWWENVPVVSWTALRGRCRTCRLPISPRYPIVEILTGALFTSVTLAWNGSALAAGYCVLAATMLAVALIELGGQRTPLAVAAAGGAAGAVLVAAGAAWQHRWHVAAGVLVGAALGAIAYSVLRSLDPACERWAGRGRAALVVGGAWLGGLGGVPGADGLAAFVASYLVLAAAGHLAGAGDAGGAGDAPASPARRVLGAPVAGAVAIAMVVSLVAQG